MRGSRARAARYCRSDAPAFARTTPRTCDFSSALQSLQSLDEVQGGCQTRERPPHRLSRLAEVQTDRPGHPLLHRPTPGLRLPARRGHLPGGHQAKVPDVESVVGRPPAVEQRRLREAFEGPPASPVPRLRRGLRLLAGRERLERRVRRPEPELPVEPERAGLDPFVVSQPDLERVDGKRRHAEEVAKEPQEPDVDEGRLAVPEGREDVEADAETA